MPLTKRGKEVLGKFKEQYGEKRGERIFWASLVSGKVPDRGLHSRGSGKLEKAKKTHHRKRKK